MPDSGESRLKGMAFMAVSLALVLLGNALARDLASRYPVGEVLFLRFLVSLVVIVPLAWRDAGIAAFMTGHPLLHLGRAACGISAVGILYAATQHLPFADLIALSYTAPLFVALLSPFLLGERVDARLLKLILLGFGGVLLIATPNQFGMWSIAVVGIALLNALCAIGARHFGRKDGVAVTTALFALYGTALSLPVGMTDFAIPMLVDLPVFAALGLVTGLAIHLNALAFRAAPAASVAPVDNFGIVAAAGIGWVAWGELPTLAAMAGGTLITVSGLLILHDARRAGTALDRYPSGVHVRQKAL
jgi:drug/metabolite transporter (DMT)-like permease